MKTNHAISILKNGEDYKLIEAGSYHIFNNGIGQTLKRIYPVFKLTPAVFKMLKKSGNIVKSEYKNIKIGDIVKVCDVENYYIEVIEKHKTYITMSNMVDYTESEFEKGVTAFHWNKLNRFHCIEDDTPLNWLVKDKPLTLSDKYFMKGLMSGLNEMEAIEMAYPKGKSNLPAGVAKNISESEKLGFHMQQELVKKCEERGIDLDALAGTLSDLLNSKSDSVRFKTVEKLMALLNMPVMNKTPLIAVQQVNNSAIERPKEELNARDKIFKNASELMAKVEDEDDK